MENLKKMCIKKAPDDYENLPIEEKIKIISELVVGMKQYEWSKIRFGIDRLYSSATSKVANHITLTDAEKIEKSLNLP